MKILIILTSQHKLGDTGKRTGFWLEEFAAPYYVLLDGLLTLKNISKMIMVNAAMDHHGAVHSLPPKLSTQNLGKTKSINSLTVPA